MFWNKRLTILEDRIVSETEVDVGGVYRLFLTSGQGLGLWMRCDDDMSVMVSPLGRWSDQCAGAISACGFRRHCLEWKVTKYANSIEDAMTLELTTATTVSVPVTEAQAKKGKRK